MSVLFEKIAKCYDTIVVVMGLANEKKLFHYIKDVKELEVADIGGGTGTLAAMLIGKGANITIIDPCIPMTNMAKQKNSLIKVINAIAEKIPVVTATFDMVCMRDSLHHIEGQKDALEEAVRILKPNGIIIIQEFDPASILVKCLSILERGLGEKTRLVSHQVLVEILKGFSVQGEIYWISQFEYVFVGCKIESI